MYPRGTYSEVFRECVRQILVPSLKHGDMVIVDNLSAHKDSKTKEAIEAAVAQLVFLSTYSPDLNPIEKMWNKVKEKLRVIGGRNYDSLNGHWSNFRLSCKMIFTKQRNPASASVEWPAAWVTNISAGATARTTPLNSRFVLFFVGALSIQNGAFAG